MSIPVLSFFTGGGFLDIGFEQAGFDIVWTNENNPIFADLYAQGISAWRESQGTGHALAEVSNQTSIEGLKASEVLDEAFCALRPNVFGVIGGPPCPDFSRGGKNGGSNGQYGRLTRTFVELICELKPGFFVIENVPGLIRTKKHRRFLYEMVEELEVQGYGIDLRTLNALEFGVPQDRERLFVVGLRQNLANQILGRQFWPSERDWFPWPEDARYKDAKSFRWPGISDFGGTPFACPGLPKELTVFSCFAGAPEPEDLPNGRDYFKPYSSKFNNRSEGDVSSKSFKRLHRYRYSPTAWYGNNEVHLHPWKPRRLSVREALRLQSVPDEYVLPAGGPLSAKFKLIGNGVPCVLANRIASALLSFLSHREPAHATLTHTSNEQEVCTPYL